MALPRLLITLTSCLLCPDVSWAQNQDRDLALLFLPACNQQIDGFAAKVKEPYAQWRQQNPAREAQFDQRPTNAEALSPRTPPTQSEPAQLQGICESLLDWLTEPRSADQRFVNPEQTWKSFMSALRKGDLAVLEECFDPGARSMYMPALKTLSKAELTEMAASFTNFELTAPSMEDFRQGVVTRADGISGLVLFLNSKRGWRISQL
jgi:hypothetical protein